MRFFKHGDVLAIVLPESLRKKYDVKEGDEYEFVEVGKGFYALVTKEKASELFKKEVLEKAVAPPPKTFLPANAIAKTSVKQLLQQKGFLVLENEAQAKEASAELEKDIKVGAIRGVRSFDKKFYLCTREFFEASGQAVEKALAKTDLTASDVSQATKQGIDATLATLYLLKEEGEIIEKKRGVFALVR